MQTADFTDDLQTLGENGKPPETRMASAQACQNLVNRYYQNDQAYRARKRATTQGLVDGNPPYKSSDQLKFGRKGDANINWRIAEAYLNSAKDAFYDIFSEAPTYATIELDLSDETQRQEWSGIATEEFERLQRDPQTEEGFDYNMQLSQLEMVMFGCGPFVFQDAEDWRARAHRCGELLVPEHASGDINRWGIAVILDTWQPHELYERIVNPDAARDIGWNVANTRKAIMNAHPLTESGGQYLNWEWHQQAMKNGSYDYSSMSKVIDGAHLFYREFAKKGDAHGKISHVIVLRSNSNEEGDPGFLYRRIGKIERWQHVIHPMYYAIGSGGEHHAVTGMGVKMYAAMAFQNRLLCNQADKAFAPNVLFKPTSASSKEVASVGNLSNWGVLPLGFDVQQVGIAGMMDDGIAFNREISGIIASNLSQYRQNLQRRSGNPVTAKQIEYEASEQARLGKTQLNRCYEQYDDYYGEKYRRATSASLTELSPGGASALAFQKRCEKRGVPSAALRKIASVKATRIVGQGSVFERRQALEFLMGMVAMFPESGRDNLIKDVVAGRAGQFSVARYYPSSPANQRASDHHAFAMSQVADMKVGVAPIITPTQNPIIYAQTFIQAATQALESLEAGANPVEVLAFLELAGPAAAAHLKRMVGDKSREQAVKLLTKQWMQIAQLTDQLREQITAQQENAQMEQQKRMAESQEAADVSAGTDPDSQIKFARAGQDLKIKDTKAAQLLQQKDQKFRQQLAIKDADNAANLLRESANGDKSDE